MRRAHPKTPLSWLGAMFCTVLLSAGPLTASASGEDAATAEVKSGPATAGQPAHIACRATLAGVLGFKSTAARSIERNDLPGLTKLHEDINERLLAARKDMDQAFLTGSWRSPAVKQTAAELAGQMEAVHMLNFIARAFLKGYAAPARSVTASAIDANDKMFLELGVLLENLDAFNASLTSGSSRVAR